MRLIFVTLYTVFLIVALAGFTVNASPHGPQIQARAVSQCSTKSCLATQLQKARNEIKSKQRELDSAQSTARKVTAQLERANRGGNSPQFIRKRRAFTKQKALAVSNVTAITLSLRAAEKRVVAIESVNTLGPSTKKGICFNDVALSRQFTPKISWAYDWDQVRPVGLPTSVSYVPML